MNPTPKLALALAVVAVVAAATGPSGMAGAQVARGPVIVQKDKTFGRVLFTRGHRALYYSAVEKQAGRIVCTGSCLRQWPPLIVRSPASVPRRLAGVKGRFGTVRRPDGRLEVTYSGLALYTYFDDGPNQVLCNNFNRWFVVRV